MAELSALIEGCAYTPGARNMGFSHEGMPVLLEPGRMTIFGAQDEATVCRFTDWLTDMIGRASSGGAYQ